MKSFDLSELIDRRVLQAERDVARAERRVAQAERQAVQAGHRATQAEVALAAAVLAATGELQREREQVLMLQAQLAEVYASTSWRVSRPVRIASRLVQALRSDTLPPALPPAPPPPLPAAASPPEETAIRSPQRQAILQRLQGRWPG